MTLTPGPSSSGRGVVLTLALSQRERGCALTPGPSSSGRGVVLTLALSQRERGCALTPGPSSSGRGVALTLALSQRERGGPHPRPLSQRERGCAFTPAIPQRERGDGDLNVDARAFAGGAFDGQFAAEQFGALAHSLQAKVPVAGVTLQVKALTVVLHQGDQV